MMPTTRRPDSRIWLICCWVLAGLLGPATAAAQAAVVVPLTKLASFNQDNPTKQDTTQKLRHVPKNLRRYLLKYIILGGGPGQPPAQRLNFLIGRDAQERIVFVPAAAQTFDFRLKDQQVLAPAVAQAQARPFRVKYQTSHGPVVVNLRPTFSSKAFSYFAPQEQDLFLMISRSIESEGELPVADKKIALKVDFMGSRQFVFITDSTAMIRVLDGQHEKRSYNVGESFLAAGHLVTIQHISPGGDSLTVQVTEPSQVTRAFGRDPGFAFRPAALTDVQGRAVTLTGTERPLVLDFWGTWCGPCVALTPSLKALHQQYATTADIVSIALDEADKVKKYLASNAIAWTNIAIPEKQENTSLITSLKITNYPTFILIHKGIIQYRGVGEAGLKELTQQLAQLK